MIFYSVACLLLGVEDERVDAYEFHIEAMKDNVTYVTSRYGTDSELKYYFLRYMDGSLHTGYTDASDSSIIEDGDGKVSVYVEAPSFGTDFYLWLGKSASFGDDEWEFFNKQYEYHIPSGSVEYDYEIDLE